MGVMIVPLFRAGGLVDASPRLSLITCSVKNLVISMSVLRRNHTSLATASLLG